MTESESIKGIIFLLIGLLNLIVGIIGIILNDSPFWRGINIGVGIMLTIDGLYYILIGDDDV